MKGLKKRRRVQVIVLAAGAMIAAFAAFYIAAPDALQFFRSPSEVASAPPPESEVFRIGGLVEQRFHIAGNQFADPLHLSEHAALSPLADAALSRANAKKLQTN